MFASTTSRYSTHFHCLSLLLFPMLVILVSADAVFQVKQREHILQDAKKNILRAQAKQKAAYDRRHCHPEVFRVGAMVLKKDFTRKKRKGGKLDPKWKGPYEIVRSLGRGLYCLRDAHHPNKLLTRVNGVQVLITICINIRRWQGFQKLIYSVQVMKKVLCKNGVIRTATKKHRNKSLTFNAMHLHPSSLCCVIAQNELGT